MTNKPHPGVKHDTLVNAGALQMALNVLRRAGKDEVADELGKTAVQVSSSSVFEEQYYRDQAEQVLKIRQLLETSQRHVNELHDGV